jgi:hypothetical protein
MARLARIVVPGRAHHVTQRGNRREAIFFKDGDQAIYLDLLAEQTARYEAVIAGHDTYCSPCWAIGGQSGDTIRIPAPKNLTKPHPGERTPPPGT